LDHQENPDFSLRKTLFLGKRLPAFNLPGDSKRPHIIVPDISQDPEDIRLRENLGYV
jgi:hypothetical protein